MNPAVCYHRFELCVDAESANDCNVHLVGSTIFAKFVSNLICQVFISTVLTILTSKQSFGASACPSSFFHHKGFCHFPVYRQFPYSLGTSVWASYWYLLFCCVTLVLDSAVCYHCHWCCTCVLCSSIALCCNIAFFVVILSVSDSWWILLSATSETVYNQQSMPAKHIFAQFV